LAHVSSFYNDKFAFVHVPKTGGSWVMQALNAAGVPYKTMGEGAASHVGWSDMPERPYTFGFVREPATWYQSYWAYVRKADEVSDNVLDRLVVTSDDFAQFVERVCSELRGSVSNMYDHYFGPPGSIDFIGHYENLHEDLLHALATAGQVVDIEAIRNCKPFNVSSEKPELTPALRALIADAERPAIERFGYDLDSLSTVTAAQRAPR
jgi:hypothetical protein